MRVALSDVAQAAARLAIDPEDGDPALAGDVEQPPEGIPVVAPVQVVADPLQELLLVDLPRHEPIQDFLAARVDHLHAQNHFARAFGDLAQETGGELLGGGQGVVITDVDEIRLVAGDDQIIERRQSLEV